MARKSRKSPGEEKIILGLKEAIAHAAEQPKSAYDVVADRIIAAVTELNDALQKAHECAEMRVFIMGSPKKDGYALKLQPQIYKLTHTTMTLSAEWHVVKDPAFQDAAGQGLDALRKKAA